MLMGEQRQPMNSSDAGNVTDYFSSSPRDRGESNVVDAKPSIKTDLLSDLSQLTGKIPSHMPCRTWEVLQMLDEGERKVLQDALANPTVRGTWIAETLGKHGYKISAYSIQRHRRAMTGKEGCSCVFG